MRVLVGLSWYSSRNLLFSGVFACLRGTFSNYDECCAIPQIAAEEIGTRAAFLFGRTCRESSFTGNPVRSLRQYYGQSQIISIIPCKTSGF